MSPSLTTGITHGTVTGMTDPDRQAQKVAENRVRRIARRQFLTLQRSPLRDRRAIGYATYRLRNEDGALVAGRDDRGNDFGLSLDEVEKYLTTPR